MRGIRITELNGQPCVAKHYPRDETELYKCYGSGYRNEAIVGGRCDVPLPRALDFRDTESEQIAYLELLDGDPRRAIDLGSSESSVAGALLGDIHRTCGDWFGPLDGCRRYGSWHEAWRPRWRTMLGVVETVDQKLAERLAEWGDFVLDEFSLQTPPRLVHGDFGPGNLMWLRQGRGAAVIDWEHARYGHPAEDWAKICLAEIFPENNGFSDGSGSGVADVWRGWLSAAASFRGEVADCPRELLRLLAVYYAGTLGVFLETGEARLRHDWVVSIIENPESDPFSAGPWL